MFSRGEMWRVAVLVVAGLACVRSLPAAAPQADVAETTEASLQLQPEEEARAVIAQANNAFGIDLYKAVSANASGNLLLSPLSASAALALTWLGTGGRTAQQLQGALHLPQDPQRVRQGFKALIDALQASNGVEVNIANKMFVQEDFAVKPSYRQAAEEYFRSDAQQLNFNTENEAAHQIINDWVENATNGKIKNLFPHNTISRDAVLILVNAIYFRGEWLRAFRENETRDEPFHVSEGSQVTVPMMNGVINTGFTRIRELGCSIMEMPYKGSSMRMLVLLPDKNDGLAKLEESISQIDFNDLQFFTTELRVKLPKFKIESKLLLKKKLKMLGVNDLFSERANLTALSDASNIVVSKVIQKALIEVNEKGTVAAVATAVETISRSGRISRDFHANRPFIFVIQGVDGNIMFMGRLSNPKAD